MLRGCQVALKYAWAIPDERAVRIVTSLSPVIEVGSGRGYWGRLVQDAGGVIHCYDKYPEDPYTEPGEDRNPNWCDVKKGGPESVLRHPDCDTLMLCYPDDFEDQDTSVALECMELFKGSTVIHVGELYGQTVCKPGAFGKTTSPDAQVYLAENFHKVLQVPLPCWSANVDSLTVWKRTNVTEIEDQQYADIPPEQKIDLTMCCEEMKHLM